MQRLLPCVCLLSTLLYAQKPDSAEHRHFGSVAFGNSVDLLPFPCPHVVMCEGSAEGKWVHVQYFSDRRINMIEVFYNAKKLGGDYVSSRTLHLVEALRDHSYANNPGPFKLAIARDQGGRQFGWTDQVNHILYETDPDDPEKGIIKVDYLSLDAPIFAAARSSPELDQKADEMYAYIAHPPCI